MISIPWMKKGYKTTGLNLPAKNLKEKSSDINTITE